MGSSAIGLADRKDSSRVTGPPRTVRVFMHCRPGSTVPRIPTIGAETADTSQRPRYSSDVNWRSATWSSAIPSRRFENPRRGHAHTSPVAAIERGRPARWEEFTDLSERDVFREGKDAHGRHSQGARGATGAVRRSVRPGGEVSVPVGGGTVAAANALARECQHPARLALVEYITEIQGEIPRL